ncbi:MAG: hypothetical protein HC905_17105 [Bacteroidales bacterium]|nr:hypothetical protein [Bacteroidales bacterium]
MKTKLIFYTLLVIMSSCKNVAVHDNNISVAIHFIDAFYSFNKDSLMSILSKTDMLSKRSILYYQGWAECGNYEILNRNDCIEKNDSLVLCPITVEDDLIGALKIDFNTTDTFHLTIIDGKIRDVQISSNDPDMYFEAKEWVNQNLPELIEKPCEGIWKDGTTPCECVKAMVEGFTEFITNRNPSIK